MNKNDTYEMWHPTEPRIVIDAAITRINGKVPRGDYAVGEWWTGYRIITGKELRDIERRAAKRGDVVTDEHIGHGRPGMTVLKACPDCGMMWAPQFGAKRCSKCRTKHATQASANARRGKAVAR